MIFCRTLSKDVSKWETLLDGTYSGSLGSTEGSVSSHKHSSLYIPRLFLALMLEVKGQMLSMRSWDSEAQVDRPRSRPALSYNRGNERLRRRWACTYKLHNLTDTVLLHDVSDGRELAFQIPPEVQMLKNSVSPSSAMIGWRMDKILLF